MPSQLRPNLIVGSDSLLGHALSEYLTGVGEAVVGTTRRPEMVSESCFFLDLSQSVDHWNCPVPAKVGFLCAGVTKLDTCRRYPIETARVNVRGIIQLARYLLEHGAFVIFPSTNLVFDGSETFRNPCDLPSPRTEYGRQKFSAEQELLKLGSKSGVVRFTKILEPCNRLIMNWVQALQHGLVIKPFVDMVIAPVPLRFAVEALYRISESHLTGITQISGNRDVSYEQMARYVAERLGADQKLILPVEVREACPHLEPPAANTTLDTTRLSEQLGLDPPDVWETIDLIAGFRT